jgi:hypothetical protein
LFCFYFLKVVSTLLWFVQSVSIIIHSYRVHFWIKQNFFINQRCTTSLCTFKPTFAPTDISHIINVPSFRASQNNQTSSNTTHTIFVTLRVSPKQTLSVRFQALLCLAT